MNKNTKTTETFIKELQNIFGDFYDYSKVVYTHSKVNVHIICPLHGDSFKKPNKIFVSGYACKSCSLTSKRTSKESYIEKAKLKHGDKCDYSLIDYINSYTNINIRCNEHNVIVNMNPNSHLKGSFNCFKCRIKSNSDYIKDAIKIHKNLYDYSLVNYTGSLNKINIICKTHGVFEQVASVHLSGSGCTACNSYNGYTKSKYVELCNNHYEGLSNFYIIKLFNKNEIFYKIGITCKEINKRYKKSQLKLYSKEDITFLEELSAHLVFDLEKHLISKYSEYKYTPLDLNFDGKTKCIHTLPQNYQEGINDFITKKS